MQPGQRVLLKEFSVNEGGARSGIDQPGCHAKGFTTGRREPKAAGVGRETRVKWRGNLLSKRHPEPEADLVDNAGGCLRSGVFEPAVGQIVFADMVIDHHDPVAVPLEHFAHRSQLRPGAGVEYHQ